MLPDYVHVGFSNQDTRRQLLQESEMVQLGAKRDRFVDISQCGYNQVLPPEEVKHCTLLKRYKWVLMYHQKVHNVLGFWRYMYHIAHCMPQIGYLNWVLASERIQCFRLLKGTVGCNHQRGQYIVCLRQGTTGCQHQKEYNVLGV